MPERQIKLEEIPGEELYKEKEYNEPEYEEEQPIASLPAVTEKSNYCQ